MHPLSTKNQEKVLKILLQLSEENPSKEVELLEDFPSKFPFVKPKSLGQILQILESKGYIDIAYPGYPLKDEEGMLLILPKALSYMPEQRQQNLRFWVTVMLTAIGAASAIISAILSVVQVLTP